MTQLETPKNLTRNVLIGMFAGVLFASLFYYSQEFISQQIFLFAEKYFFQTNKSNQHNYLTKNMILNQWCAVEAAIKWDHGKLAKDINHWQFFEKPKELIHKKKNIHLNYSNINFYHWTIALAYEEKTSFNSEIICCSKNF